MNNQYVKKLLTKAKMIRDLRGGFRIPPNFQ